MVRQLNYSQIEAKLNYLQKEFFQLFREAFPDLADKIEIEKGIIHPDNFCFSVKSWSEVFGKLQFDIDDTEITVFCKFDHRHFETYIYNKENNQQRRIELACISALNYINEIVTGNIIIEYKQQGNKIFKSMEYRKDDPTSPFSATVLLKESLTTKLKQIFKRQPIVTKKVNWFGEIK